MARINEGTAAKEYVAKLVAGKYPLERAKNDGVNYCEKKEERDAAAVKEFTKTALFEELKKMK